MSLSHRLSDSLRRALGEEAAEEFVGWRDQVEMRRVEAAEFRETVRGDIAELRQDIRNVETRLREEIHSLRTWIIGLAIVCGVNMIVSFAALIVAVIALRK